MKRLALVALIGLSACAQPVAPAPNLVHSHSKGYAQLGIFEGECFTSNAF